MARQVQQFNYNSFSGGLVTEASPLTFPDGASIDESNFELTKQGFRRRRLGMEAISASVATDNTPADSSEVVTFLWEDTGNSGETYLVVAIRNEVLIYNITLESPGENLVYKSTLPYRPGSRVSFTAHSGSLIAATGAPFITVIRALGNNLFSERQDRLKVRDRVGVSNYSKNDDLNSEKVDLLTAERAGVRPTAEEVFVAGQPSNVVFNFTSKRTVAPWKTELFISESAPAYMGYPISTFLLEQVSTSYYINVIFKDRFFKEAIGSDVGTLIQTDGLSYRVPITQTQYNEFLALTRPLILFTQIQMYNPHLYNLWNQGWGEPRMISANSADLINPIDNFYPAAGERFPSMADSVNYALFPDNSQESNRTSDRFHPDDLVANPPGSLQAPKGKYVIDAISRGESRVEQWTKDLAAKGRPTAGTSISNESSVVGAQTVAEYAGRVWYAGFEGDSPGSTLPLSNKVLYSQVGDELQNCYQESDPTSNIDNQLVETDGGWVNIDAIDRVVKLVTVDTALMVFATNGVWAISGIDGNSFTPLDSHVTKLTEKGAVSPQSIVVVDSDVFFWSEDGAYRIVSSGFAQFSLEPITKGIINDLVIGLAKEDLNNITGAYDERLERVVWLIDRTDANGQRRELVYHLLFGAFTVNSFNAYTSEAGAQTSVISLVRIPLFEALQSDDKVVSGTDNVVAGVDRVVSKAFQSEGKLSRIAYIGLEDSAAEGSNIFFADLVRGDFKDWGQVDANAYMITGYVSGGDAARMKSVPFLMLHCNRTETNATAEGVGNQSSCMVQSQWEWTTDPFANKWGIPFQGYRLPKPQIRGLGQPVAEGVQVVTTKTKVRGRGRVVSLMFSTEPDKDCQILGWEMIVGANNNV